MENKKPPASQMFLKSLSNITTTIKSVFCYDPRLIFIDSFEKISQQLNNVIDLINSVMKDPKDYWIIYDIVIAIIPICEQIIFNGYSDQILEFLLNINSSLSSILIFCTSRFLPFRLQLFSTICSAFANTEETREKDADAFIQSFKNDVLQLKQLESSNVNGLTEPTLLCNGEKCTLKTLFETALNAIELMSVHFNTEEIVFDRSGSSRKNVKKPQKKPTKDEPPQAFPPPPPQTINLICNAYNSPLSKTDYISKYGQAIQAWANTECQLAPALLYRLIYSFLKAGKTLEGYETLSAYLPDDKIVQLAVSISNEQWIETSEIIEKLTKEEIQVDYQFYNEIAAKLWKLYISGDVTDPNILKGVLHVLILSPHSCPMQMSMTALHYCWHLVKIEKYNEAVKASESAITILEDYRDIYTIRTIKRVLPSMTKIPNKPVNEGYKLFNKWIECLHTDLLTVYIQSKLKYGVQIDTEKARIKFSEDIEKTKIECQKTKELYGTLSIKQKEKFDSLLNRQFKAPEYSPDTENYLLSSFKNNRMALALLYTQMSFFRPKKALSFLEKARQALDEYKSSLGTINSPILYVNRTEVGLFYPYSTPEAKTVAAFGKETVGSTGLTISNTALCGTGIKQDMIEPFIITKLKPNTLYTMGFGAFDSQNELIDNITSPFPVITCHSLSFELIYSYMASASYHLHDVQTFDLSLTYLLNRFVDVNQVSDDHAYFKNLNPFNKFSIKPSTFSEPAPMLRAFSTSLMMAARLFMSKPLHAASFEKLAIILSQTLSNYELVLQICSELFAILQPALVNAYSTKWVIHPLIYVINTLKHNKQTQKLESHQNLAAKASFALDSLIVQYYQERQLASFALNCVVELQPNQYRTAFMLFASKNRLLENNVNDATLPLVAAEMFRTSPEKSYDDLFAKFKLDPQFLPCVVYLVSAAHHAGYCQQAITWCSSALEYIKTTLQESDDTKSQKKAPSRANSKLQQKKRPTTGRGKKNEPVTKSPDEENEIQAATKIQTVWARYKRRKNNLNKYALANKYRAALNLLMAMCLIETDQSLVNTAQDFSKSSKKDPKHQTKGRVSKHSTPARKTSSLTDEDPAISDQAFNIITTLRRAIVIGNRINDLIIIQSASTLLRVYLSSLNIGSSTVNMLSPMLSSLCSVSIRNTELVENYAQKLLKEILILMLYDNQIENIKLNLIDACSICNKSGQFYWMISNQDDIPTELIKVNEDLRKRDPSENQFYDADSIYQRYILFPEDQSLEVLDKSVHDIAIQLQHKQKLSLSVCLLSKLAFTLFDKKQNQTAYIRLCEALEGHFRIVKAHEKIDQILHNETEASFYQKHSWSGCLSIFVISSLLSTSFDHSRAMQATRLASFALASLFAACPFNPSKQVDFADFEPSEIIPGVDIFSEYDARNPLLECAPLEYITISISILLSSMLSYEMYFEMFKPLAFARHFFRYILRDKRYLARARLMNVIACSQFGFLNQAINSLNDVLTNYGDPRVTKDTTLYPPTSKRFAFDVTDNSINSETIKSIASTPNVTLIQNQYGFSISCLYVIAISKFLQNVSACSDPSNIDLNKQQGNISTRNTRHTNKKAHHNKTNDQLNNTLSTDSFESSLKMAENLVNEMLSKDFKTEQFNIKLELELEKSILYMNQWRWEDAILIAQSIIKANPCMPILKSCYYEQPCLLPNSFVRISSQIMANASFNLHDYQNAGKFASPYLKSLLFIEKADYESAVDLLTKITLHPPITEFHKEYILAVGQLVQLFCFNHKLFENAQNKYSKLLTPVDLINKLDLDTYSFFVNQLAMNEARSYYIRNTHLLIRIKHLMALTNTNFNGTKHSIDIIQNAQELMSNQCPYISHGLSFLLASSYCRIQVQSILMNNPLLIQNWNKEINPLTSPNLVSKVQPELIDKIIEILNTMFLNSPDCVVHPASQQCILDYAFFVGISSNSKKLEQSYLVLQTAATIRSSHRFIQSMIVQCPNTPPTTCPNLLLNENKDAKLRTIAASYYSHVCGLNNPYFDSEILEMRTLFYFKCFEDQCSQFKAIQKGIDQIILETGQIVGQWYVIDSKLLKFSTPNDAQNATVTAGKSMLSSRRPPSQATSRGFTSNATTTSRPSTAMSRTKSKNMTFGKGSLSFFIGIIINGDENAAKKTTKSSTVKSSSKDLMSTNSSLTENVNRYIPLLLVSQPPDLRDLTNDMAEVGLALEDVNRMESSEAQGEAPPPKEEKDDSKKKRKPASKTKSITNTEVHQQVSLLKNQAQISLTNADIKWKDASHKAVALFNKSNRIFASINEPKNRYPAQVTMDSIEMPNSTMLSHFFNSQYGINEKAPQFAEWLSQNFTTATFTMG